MTVIYKYPLSMNDEAIEMPRGAKILSVQAQGGQPVLWAMVHPGGRNVKRKIRLCVTGGETPDATYIGTVQLAHGTFVAHFFDLGEVDG